MAQSRSVQSTQKELIRKHQEAKSRVNYVSGVGGGVSLWPAMDDMRLSCNEMIMLLVSSLSLMLISGAIFLFLHGSYIRRLQHYSLQFSQFTGFHCLNFTDQNVLDKTIINWHNDFLQLKDNLTKELNVVWSQSSIFDVISLVLYVFGIIILLYYLGDNMFAKSRLTPHRIKTWVSLLCVTGTWTIFAVIYINIAYSVETAAKELVYNLLNEKGSLILTSLDLTKVDQIISFWTAYLLPPTGRGLLTVMGLVPLQDIVYYFQYYSLPILTALLTPVIKLIMSLRAVYKTNISK